MTRSILYGDVAAVLAGIPDHSFDAILCDPPYGYQFMGKKWDYAVPSVETWAECLRVLKPGAHMMAFGGPRTYHRLACGVEDAGFELRDMLMFLHAKGFPKSQNVSLALAGATGLAELWDGYGTALKPAFEPICLARKTLDGTMAENVAKWGVGGLAIDTCRIEADLDGNNGYHRSGWSKSGSKAGNNVAMSGANYAREPKPDAEGRWPAHLLLDEEAAAMLDAQAGERPSRRSITRNGGGGGMLPGASLSGIARADSGYSDSGGASRFFFTSKVSTREREAGCEHNRHPTLKPLSLTTWLARLIMPPTSGRILVPFSGSGSEMIGAMKAGWTDITGIEQSADYVAIAEARLAYWAAHDADYRPTDKQETLF